MRAGRVRRRSSLRARRHDTAASRLCAYGEATGGRFAAGGGIVGRMSRELSVVPRRCV